MVDRPEPVGAVSRPLRRRYHWGVGHSLKAVHPITHTHKQGSHIPVPAELGVKTAPDHSTAARTMTGAP